MVNAEGHREDGACHGGAPSETRGQDVRALSSCWFVNRKIQEREG